MLSTLQDIFGISSKHVEKEVYRPWILVPVEDQPLIEALKLDSYEGIVAGGAARLWYQGHSVATGYSDVDIWLKSRDHYLQAYEILRKIDKNATVFETDMATTFKFEQPHKEIPFIENLSLQLIHFRFFENVQEIFDYFDITVAKIATNGRQWHISPEFLRDHAQHRLNFDNLRSETAVKRLIKYWIYGLEPTDQTIQQIIDCQETCWDFTNKNQEDY